MYYIIQNENSKLQNQLNQLQQFYNNEIVKSKSFMIDKKYYEDLLKKYNNLEEKIKNKEIQIQECDEIINDMRIDLTDYKKIHNDRQNEIIQLTNKIQNLEQELTKQNVNHKEILNQKNAEIKQTIKDYKNLSIKINKDKYKKQKIQEAQFDDDNLHIHE